MAAEQETIDPRTSASEPQASPGGEPRPGSFVLLLMAVSIVYALNGLALESTAGAIFTWASRVGVLLASVYLLSRTTRSLIVALVASGVTLGLEAEAWAFDHRSGRLFLDTATIGFMIWVLYSVLRGVFRRDADSRGAVVGSAVGYMIILSMFTRLHTLLEDLWPGSYQSSGPELSAMSEEVMNATFQYFSTVTMTTLGFGDIVPVTRVSQFATGLEAVVGQLYIAVVVASLVGRAAERR